MHRFVSKFGRNLSNTVHNSGGVKMLFFVMMFGFLGTGLVTYFNLGYFTTFVIVYAVYMATGGWRFLRILIKTFPRDYRGAKIVLRMRKQVASHIQQNKNIPELFAEFVQTLPNKTAFISESSTWTYREVDEYSNAIANYFYNAGYRQGDTIAIFMESRPEYVCLWLGLAKIGVVSALINFNLRHESLNHCIQISECKAVIFGTELTPAVKDIFPSLVDMQLFTHSQGGGQRSDQSTNQLLNEMSALLLDSLLETSSTRPPPKHLIKFTDRLFYIYTSGTTGLPKAAIITHLRFFTMASAFKSLFDMTNEDIIYDMLPLYHSAGGIVGVGQTVLNGITVMIRPKFSASNFWLDCVKYNCTIIQYIGETCRYLLAQPYRPEEKQHKVRLAIGNGLRPQIWEEFTTRFNIKEVGEFYGATEGNANSINLDNTVGCVGVISQIVPQFLQPSGLVKVNEATGDLLRDSRGMCIVCKPGESGELVGKIKAKQVISRFDGYVNTSATQKKIAHDVFSRGDSVFCTGDLLVLDELGHLFFKDRTGDTFRWKGENVATAEVEAVIHNIVKLKDATVYGVEIPGVEGKAGMAAIVDESHDLDINNLHQQFQKSLPTYARPVFLRLLNDDSLETTGTHKLKKTNIRNEGFNPKIVKDRLYYIDIKTGSYKEINDSVYRDICNGKVRF